MTRQDLVLGVDGGNTKTVALVMSLDGTVVGWGRAGCSDIYGAASVEAAFQELEAATEAALRSASARHGDLKAIACSMAGADWPEDFDLLAGELSGRGLGGRLIVVNDALGALRAGSEDGTGVSVVCGTGAATGARSAHGDVWHSSWWQEPQGSRHLAQKALWAVYRAELGIDPPTHLTGHVLEILGQDNVEDVLRLFTARRSERPRDLAPITSALLEEAARGDQVARRIVWEHGDALGAVALAAARRVGIAHLPFTLVLAGGVLRHPSRALSDALVGRVLREAPGVRPVLSRFEPAVGAAFLALEAARVCIDDDVRARTSQSLPPCELFATDPLL